VEKKYVPVLGAEQCTAYFGFQACCHMLHTLDGGRVPGICARLVDCAETGGISHRLLSLCAVMKPLHTCAELLAMQLFSSEYFVKYLKPSKLTAWGLIFH
jgi:hypothetical protein